MADTSRSYFSIGSLRDVRQNIEPIVNCLDSRTPFAITVPKEFKHFEAIKRMLEMREPGKNLRTRSEEVRDIFRNLRAKYYYSLLVTGFGNDTFTSKVQHDIKGVTVLFDPIPHSNR